MNEDEIFTEIPDNLKAIEDEVVFANGDGGFRLDGTKLYWFNRWIGDASEYKPQNTTWQAIIDARAIICPLGYVTTIGNNDHDYAEFQIVRKAKELIEE